MEKYHPVARQNQQDLHRYCGCPFYLGGTDLLGTAPALAKAARTRLTEKPEPAGDPYPRTVEEIAGYFIATDDRKIGKERCSQQKGCNKYVCRKGH